MKLDALFIYYKGHGPIVIEVEVLDPSVVDSEFLTN